MKVWITKYALTQGIEEKEAELFSNTRSGNAMIEIIGTDYPEYYQNEGKDWCRTRESAIARAEELRQKKIVSLKKQIKKYEEMKFE